MSDEGLEKGECDNALELPSQAQILGIHLGKLLRTDVAILHVPLELIIELY
jgi:hypothetical protein